MTVCVLGSANLDIVLQVDTLPLPGETVTTRDVTEHLGGKGANQAVAASRMGAATIFIGGVGQDEAGTRLRLGLSDAGVDVTHLAELLGAATGRAYVTLAGSGQNSIIVAGGANGAVRPEHVPTSATRSARVLLSQLETPVDTVASLFSGSLSPGATRILNAAPALPEGRKLFSMVDVLIVNETELMAYAGLVSIENVFSGLEEAAARLIARSNQAIIVTLGSLGAAIVRQGNVRMVPGHSVVAVDSTGAGDCFCGVLAAELDQGTDLETAVHMANAAAALSVMRFGAATAAPSRTEVEAFLANI